MSLLGVHRKLTALALCKSIESAIQWFQIHHGIAFATIQNPVVYLLGARVSIFLPWFPDYILLSKLKWEGINTLKHTLQKVGMVNQINSSFP